MKKEHVGMKKQNAEKLQQEMKACDRSHRGTFLSHRGIKVSQISRNAEKSEHNLMKCCIQPRPPVKVDEIILMFAKNNEMAHKC